MRIKETYTVYKRTMPSGRTVYYYQCYDDDGHRVCAHSTGQRTKTAARNYCNELLRAGKLRPDMRKSPTFGEFAEGWWVWDTCPYLKKRRLRREITQTYARCARSKLQNNILPYFANKRLDRITEAEIDTWLVSLTERGMQNTTANACINILITMLNEAVRQKLIKVNPATLVLKLKDDTRKIEILKPDEVRRIFPADWRTVWDSYIPYLANKLAACTGLRFGEVMGLRGEFVHEDYIEVVGQFTRDVGYHDTKTHESRNVPISVVIQQDLAELKRINGNGFLFSANGGKSPLARNTVYRELYAAFERIGIGESERKRRNITFHGWRHFFNTTLRMANVADSKVMSVTGHKSHGMTEHYTHFDTAQFTEVRLVQESLLISEEPSEDDRKRSE